MSLSALEKLEDALRKRQPGRRQDKKKYEALTREYKELMCDTLHICHVLYVYTVHVFLDLPNAGIHFTFHRRTHLRVTFANWCLSRASTESTIQPSLLFPKPPTPSPHF